MTFEEATNRSLVGGVTFVLNFGSCVAGVLGTYFMSRRYAKTFLTFIFFAFADPLMRLLGRADQVDAFHALRMKGNRDVPDAVADMISGLNLLFWAFVAQMLSLLVSLFGRS